MPIPASCRVMGLIAALGLGLASILPVDARGDEITVFAAASIKNALDEISIGFREETGHTITASLASSSALARQIQFGAPADIFISANPGWMDALEEDGLIDVPTRFNLLGNTIVLIAHGGRDADPALVAPDMDLSAMLGDDRLAMALIRGVPAGIYGRMALESLGIWDAVEAKVAQADNVRAALALVSTGEAPFGIVYATDAAADGNVTIIGRFPADAHPPIVYPAAAVAASENPLNTQFLAYLRGPDARQAFERQGFVVVAD